MRSMFEISRETTRLVSLMSSMRVDESMAFKEASESVGFSVTSSLPAYQSARRIVAKDDIIIDGVRGVGFKRLSGSDVVTGRGAQRARQIRGAAKRGHREMISASRSSNLNEEVSRLCSERITRFAIIGDQAREPRSNRRETHTPPAAEQMNMADVMASIKG